MTADEPPHQICSYTLQYSLFLHFLYIVNPPLHTSTPMWSCSHLLHRTDLAYLMDTWFMIHMYLLLFLVSPTCTLPQSDQSWALALRSQALHFGWALCSLLLLFIFNLPVFIFRSTEEPENYPYEFPPELRFSTYTSHHLTLISHRTASQSHCLYPTPHLEMIPYPQIAPSEPHRIYTEISGSIDLCCILGTSTLCLSMESVCTRTLLLHKKS